MIPSLRGFSFGDEQLYSEFILVDIKFITSHAITILTKNYNPTLSPLFLSRFAKKDSGAAKYTDPTFFKPLKTTHLFLCISMALLRAHNDGVPLWSIVSPWRLLVS